MTARAIVLLQREDDADLKRWATAAAIVVAAHLGLLATYFVLVSHAPAGAPTPIIIDMSPMPMSPASPADAEPGPEMLEAPPPPEPQLVEPLPPEPLIEPPPPMIQPLVALPEPPKEPPPPPEVKEEPKVKPPEVKRVDRKKPTPRTAPAPRSDLATADKPAAPSPGAASSSAALASWRDLVAAQLQRAKRYPSGAESRREQGVVTVRFTVSRSGSVLSRSIARSSGYSELDQEVLAMLARASPFPQFPPGMNQASVSLTVPVRFSVR
jgi:protein TonB